MTETLAQLPLAEAVEGPGIPGISVAELHLEPRHTDDHYARCEESHA